MEKARLIGSLRLGEGTISGIIALALAGLSLLGVLAFHFPQYLTTPELRAAYDVALLRDLLFVSLVLSGSLALTSFMLGGHFRLGGSAWLMILIAIALGGHRIEITPYEQSALHLGLDWFILDLLGSTIIFVLIEKLFPFRKQPILRPEWDTDLKHFALNHLLISFALLLTNQFVFTGFGWAMSHDIQGFIQSQHFLVQLFLILLAADLVQYTLHRGMHEIPFLWRFHAVHHSSKYMDWLAGSRLHILELLVTRSFVLAPVYVLGFSKEVVDAYIIIVGFQAVFNHANVQVPVGWLKYLIVTPQFHHWHHSSDQPAIDRNYAAHFAFLDYLFGTAVQSKDEWPQDYGVRGDYVPDGLIRQQAFPFVWRSESPTDGN